MDEVKEIRRQRILIPPGMTTGEIREKYDLNYQSAWRAKSKGFL